MSGPRKVFIASSLSQDALSATFNQWPVGFEKTTEIEEAEFIVVDLGNLPDNWLNYFGMRTNVYIPTQNLPFFLLTTTGELPSQFEEIKQKYKPTKPPVLESASELFNALQWMEKTFPFYNAKKIPSEAVDLLAAR